MSIPFQMAGIVPDMEDTKKHGAIAGQIGAEKQTCILRSQKSLKL